MVIEKASLSVSVVVEWYNMTYADLDRARRMLASLKLQSAELLTDEPQQARLSSPLELIVVFDSNCVDGEQVRRLVCKEIEGSSSVMFRSVSAPGATYCEMKNAGAAVANGEILIFLDCDVIPEPGWLSAFVSTFADPEIAVVVGNTYVDYSRQDIYTKAMALAWMFPMRDAVGGLGPLKMFYANNLAFRKEVFLQRMFPHVEGFIHAPAGLLVERLESEGVTIWSHGDARASHPPPKGVMHFARRAISGGKARALARGTIGSARIFRIGRWFRDDLVATAYSWKVMVTDGFKVGLRRWQIPAAMAIGATYNALLLLGSLLSLLAPGVMRPRFRL